MNTPLAALLQHPCGESLINQQPASCLKSVLKQLHNLLCASFSPLLSTKITRYKLSSLDCAKYRYVNQTK